MTAHSGGVSQLNLFPPPQDGGHLVRRNGDDGSMVYEGEKREYSMRATKTPGKVLLAVKLEGSDHPETETVNLTSITEREKFAKRLAGKMNPPLAKVIEEDLRQIAADNATLKATEPRGENKADQEPQFVARFDTLVDLVRVASPNSHGTTSATKPHGPLLLPHHPF